MTQKVNYMYYFKENIHFSISLLYKYWVYVCVYRGFRGTPARFAARTAVHAAYSGRSTVWPAAGNLMKRIPFVGITERHTLLRLRKFVNVSKDGLGRFLETPRGFRTNHRFRALCLSGTACLPMFLKKKMKLEKQLL